MQNSKTKKQQVKPVKRAKKILDEFKEFISRGSVIDLSIGLIMGTAFTAIVNSLVKEIFMPLFSMLISGIDFTHWKYILKPGTEATEDTATGIITNTSAEIAITYGNFIQQVVNFLIISIAVFIMVKTVNRFRHLLDAEAMANNPSPEKEKASPEKDKASPEKEEVSPEKEEILLLREIRDLLKTQSDDSAEEVRTPSESIE
ncbi:MAG: large conductance mechanosensitive channel protein MscL [Peptococcaceae bacterium]|nr:large conductance mechanosensitive channel protein MscL [Peptococcaceae bacterium]